VSNDPAKCTSHGEGVYYASNDYTSLVRRLLILVVDAGVVFLVGYGLAIMQIGDYLFEVWLGLSYLYLAVLEQSAIGTLGFLVTGVRIVNLKGERPSILRMSFRLALWLVVPFHLLFDLIWLSGDPCKQSFRDKLAGTYVVRKGAQPIGRGKIKRATLMVAGMAVTFLEVEKRLQVSVS
jgi:uncharacterized RDD family membrane protein YckC